MQSRKRCQLHANSGGTACQRLAHELGHGERQIFFGHAARTAGVVGGGRSHSHRTTVAGVDDSARRNHRRLVTVGAGRVGHVAVGDDRLIEDCVDEPRNAHVKAPGFPRSARRMKVFLDAAEVADAVSLERKLTPERRRVMAAVSFDVNWPSSDKLVALVLARGASSTLVEFSANPSRGFVTSPEPGMHIGEKSVACGLRAGRMRSSKFSGAGRTASKRGSSGGGNDGRSSCGRV
jgi:hypothetical protein